MKMVNISRRLAGVLGICMACSAPDASKQNEHAQPPYEADDDDEMSDIDNTPPARRPLIYQLVVRTFGNINETRKTDGTLGENGVGKFANINEAALSSLASFGITHIWLTGILRQATLTDYSDLGLPPDDPDIVKGLAGSFFAVKDYYDVSPDYAVDPTQRLAEFSSLVDRIHAAGMKVLIDLVPNHVSRAYASTVKPDKTFGKADDVSVFFSAENHFFYLVNPAGQSLNLTRPAHWNPADVPFDGAFPPEDGSTPQRVPKVSGNDVTSPSPSEHDWYETVKLNYGYNFAAAEAHFDPRPPVWDAMDDIIAYWQALGVDGFRCDMAHMVPVQAWEYLIAEARERDVNVYFLGEAYADLPELVAAGFDAVYYDPPYDLAKSIYQGTSTQDQLAEEFGSLSDELRNAMLTYLENHDERRIPSPVEAGSSPENSGFGSASAAKQLAPIFFLYHGGPILIHNGQELGEEGAGIEGFSQNDGRTSIFDYWSVPALVAWSHGHAYDGGGSSAEALALRQWYAELNAVAQLKPMQSTRYWGLKYFNRSSVHGDANDHLYSFARFATEGEELLLVVANFAPSASASGMIRIPQDLAEAAGLDADLSITKIFDDVGANEAPTVTMAREVLVNDGFFVEVQDQAANVYRIY